MCQLIFTKATWAPDEELLAVTKGLQEILAKTRWSQDVFVNVDRIPLVDLWVQHGVQAVESEEAGDRDCGVKRSFYPWLRRAEWNSSARWGGACGCDGDPGGPAVDTGKGS